MSTSLTDVKTLVVKVGTTLLTGPNGFDGRVVEGLVIELAALRRERGFHVVLVSSGAIGCGMSALGMTERPALLPLKQATAAVGQSILMHYYETLFRNFGDGLRTAQVLLTASDLDDRQKYLNVRYTMKALFDLGGVVPIVNENDSVATEEIQFGDNDTLAARVAAGIDADLLLILSDVDGLYDRNPAQNQEAQLIPRVESVTGALTAGAGESLVATSTGGMRTKLEAAKIAAAAGVPAIIANGHRQDVVRGVFEGTAPHTVFDAPTALSHRKRWIAFGRASRGRITVDDGAARALCHRGRSLLAAGITGVTGRFEAGAAVRVGDAAGRDLACGIVNYSSEAIEAIKGCRSSAIEAILGRKDYDEVIHRDNLVLLS